MAIIYVISVKNVLSTSELSSSKSAKQFLTNIISEIVVDHIVIDFSDVKQMNFPFALQYLETKQHLTLKKKIKEIGMSKSVCQMFQMAQKEIDQSSLKPLNNKEILQKQLPT